MQFDRILIVDWSAASGLSPARASADAIWLGSTSSAGESSRYFRSRALAEAAISAAIDETARLGQRLLIGFDFPMGYPVGFAAKLTGLAQAPAVWKWLADHITDDGTNRNNRFEIAAKINQRFGNGPFWGRPASIDLEALSPRKTVNYAALGLAERRLVETLVHRAQPVWKLYTIGAAGSQGLMGQPMIHRLSGRGGVSVWPFQPLEGRVVLTEVYPSLLASAVANDAGTIKDEVQVRLLSRALFTLSQRNQLAPLLAVPDNLAAEEGWILGAGHIGALEAGLE